MVSNKNCLIMGKSFITEWMIENKITKKNFHTVAELNDKLSALIVKSVGNKDTILKEVEKSAIETTQVINKVTNEKDIEISSLTFGIGFIQLLIERNYFRQGSESMYFKRVCMELYDYCEKQFNHKEVMNSARLITKLSRNK